MRLTHLTVTNFKSVEDSGEFSIGDVTCLVGKNEAGKTALLHALHRLNPDSGEAVFDVQSSYPRRFLSEYEERHPNEDAPVLKTIWQLSDKEAAGLKEIVGPKGLSGTTVTIHKRYREKTST
jgi:predicted ATP-dependent endonuclease of OLD family